MTIAIPLTQDYTAIVDEEDADLAQLKWCVNTLPKSEVCYAKRKNTDINGEITYPNLHRVVMSRILGRSLLRSERVDHINLNGLDNRRENLRLATHAQNLANIRKHKDNHSGIKGVYWSKYHKKWHATICVLYKRTHIGYFDNIEDAAQAYRHKAVELLGEFARFE